MLKPKVFVTRRWPKIAEENLKNFFDVTLNNDDKPLSNSELAEAFYYHDALAPTVSDMIDETIIKKGHQGRGKIISNFGVGINHIDVQACKNFDITLTNTPDVLTDATADLTMLLMLMISRRSREGENEIRTGNWTGWRPTHLLGNQVKNKTLGIIGMGRIGQAVAKRAAIAFGMKIKFYNRSNINKKFNFEASQVPNIMDLCKSSDFISLHCPGGINNKHIINYRVLSAMKKSAFLINTARGDLLDEEALCKALNEKLIAGAGLDVFENEPSINFSLLSAPNLVLLPHLGSATLETRNAMGNRVLDNLKQFFDNEKPTDQIHLS